MVTIGLIRNKKIIHIVSKNGKILINFSKAKSKINLRKRGEPPQVPLVVESLVRPIYVFYANPWFFLHLFSSACGVGRRIGID